METISITSFLIFAIFSVAVLFTLINISSIISMLLLFLVPILSIIIAPSTMIPFLSHQHMALAEGSVPINNFHVLLIIWSTMLGLILYTEFLTWYLSKKKTNSSI